MKKYEAEKEWIDNYFKKHPNPGSFGLQLSTDHFPAEEDKKIVTSPQFPAFRAEISGTEDSYDAFCEWLRGSGLM